MRRSALLVVVALLVVGSCVAQMKINLNGFEKRGLRFVDSAAPDYSDQVKGLGRNAKYLADESNAVILENSSGRSIAGYKVVWTYTSPSGDPVKVPVSSVELQSLLDPGHRHALPAVSRRLIALLPGGGEVSDDELRPLRLTSAAKGSLAKLGCTAFSVEAILYDDGTAIGIDARFIEAVAESFDGEQSFFRDLLAYRKGKNEAEVLKFAREIAETDIPSRPLYSRSRTVRAQEFIRVSSRAGFASAMAIVNSAVFAARPKFQHISSSDSEVSR